MTDIEFPTDEDVSGSIFSLFAIQYTYRLPILNLARGILGKRKTFAWLSVQDIHELVRNRLNDDRPTTKSVGEQFRKIKDYAIGIEWIEGSIRYKNHFFQDITYSPFLNSPSKSY